MSTLWERGIICSLQTLRCLKRQVFIWRKGTGVLAAMGYFVKGYGLCKKQVLVSIVCLWSGRCTLLLWGVENKDQNPDTCWVSNSQWPKQELCSWWHFGWHSGKNFWISVYLMLVTDRIVLCVTYLTLWAFPKMTQLSRWCDWSDLWSKCAEKHYKHFVARLQSLFLLRCNIALLNPKKTNQRLWTTISKLRKHNQWHKAWWGSNNLAPLQIVIPHELSTKTDTKWL